MTAQDAVDSIDIDALETDYLAAKGERQEYIEWLRENAPMDIDLREYDPAEMGPPEIP